MQLEKSSETEAESKPVVSLEEAIKAIKTRPTVPLWPHAGVVLDLTRNGVYGAAARGEIDVVKFGRLKRAVSASLRKRLGMEAA